MSAAAWCSALAGSRQWSMLCFESRQCSRSVNAFVRINIDVEDPKPDQLARRNADHRVRPLTPPRLNQEGVGRRVFPAVWSQGPLAALKAGLTWEDRPACPCQLERSQTHY